MDSLQVIYMNSFFSVRTFQGTHRVVVVVVSVEVQGIIFATIDQSSPIFSL